MLASSRFPWGVVGKFLALTAPIAACSSTKPAPTQVASQQQSAPVTHVPADFVADRIFVRPVLSDGRALRLFTDSGGGTQFLFADSAKRIGLSIEDVALEGEPSRFASIPEWRAGAHIPAPLAIHQHSKLQTSYLVLDRTGEGQLLFPPDVDGFLGQGWFGGRVWTFDYVDKSVWLHDDGTVPDHTAEQEIPAHLPIADDGLPSVHFACIAVEVEGESLDLLFDTGATLLTAPASGALDVLGPGPDARGTSFITKTVFDGWHQRHPDWRIVEGAERGTGMSIIEVPRLRIAAEEVGPVWFTMRPDTSFHDFMSGMMDARVEGALGGSAFRYLRVTMDYPRQRAIVRR